jgi:methionyl-tRNA formyltransferase
LRIAFLLNRDVESNYAFNLLLPDLRNHTISVFLSERVGGARDSTAAALGQLAFIEQDLFNDLVFPRLDSESDDRGRFLSFHEFERRAGIPVQSLATARNAADVERLRRANADLFVSIRFGRILGQEALSLPRLGVLNLHSGLLPQYRGVLATFRALLNGDPEIGCTLHWIDSPGIDVGPIIETARIRVRRERSLFWHVLSLYGPGTRLILNALNQIDSGETVTGTSQEEAAGTYYSIPNEEEMILFLARGWRLFDREDVLELLSRYVRIRESQIGNQPSHGEST